jgi:hypothetical protein
MFRKLLFASATSIALMSPLALSSKADAHEFQDYHHFEHRYVHRHAYRVFYRDPYRPGWVFAATIEGHRAALQFAEHYRCRGFEIWIR